jgi:parallel beta-helix repeat protein
MLLLALVFGLLRSDRDSANQVPPSETSPEPRERIWRVGQNNLTFEQAVARAQPGDTVEVPAGRFTLMQSVLVNKSLTIRGAGPDKTTLLSWEPDFAIKFTGDRQWTLENLSLEHVGNKPADVVIVDSGVIRIRNCHFSGAVYDEKNRRGGSGICLIGTARGVVSNCVCRNNGSTGIVVSAQAQPLLEGNTCEQNRHRGIAYFNTGGGSARNNICRGNHFQGIYVADQAQPTLEANICEDNKEDGIAICGQARPMLLENRCQRNQQNGISYWDSAAGVGRNNICSVNGLHGIEVAGEAQPTLETNLCEHNKQNGIAYLESAGGTARNNICRNNGEYGIYTQPGTRAVLEGNREEGNKRRIWQVRQNNLTFEQAVARAQPGDTIQVPAGPFNLTQPIVVSKSLTIRGAGPDKTILASSAPDFAIKFTGECQWTLEGLSIEHLGGEPADVLVVDSGMITIRNCRFSGAVWDETNRRGGDGIWLTGTARGVVINCVCRNNGLHGIDVNGQAQPILEGNTCEGNKRSGIAYFDSAGGTARNNTCRNNLAGILVGGQAQPTLEGNTCEENKGDGIAYVGSAGGTARNNTCRNNGLNGIGLRNQAQPTLEGNTCEGNELDGIAYFGSAGGIARNNICRNNGDNGIYVKKGARPVLGPNILEGNRRGNLNVE